MRKKGVTYLEEKRFNLLYEPWIKVLLPDLSEREVSLLELFENAHLYRSLSGETETQNAAILRLFLAITTTIIYRYDAEGNEDHITYDAERTLQTGVWYVMSTLMGVDHYDFCSAAETGEFGSREGYFKFYTDLVEKVCNA